MVTVNARGSVDKPAEVPFETTGVEGLNKKDIGTVKGPKFADINPKASPTDADKLAKLESGGETSAARGEKTLVMKGITFSINDNIAGGVSLLSIPIQPGTGIGDSRAKEALRDAGYVSVTVVGKEIDGAFYVRKDQLNLLKMLQIQGKINFTVND